MWGRLVTFGDSWTAGHGVEKDVAYKEVIDCGQFINNLRIMNGWPRYLAEHYDVPFTNLAWCNKSNPEIIKDIEDNFNHLKNDDLIVIMLSYAFRNNGEPIRDVNRLNELLAGKNYFLVNSFYPTFEEVKDFTLPDLSRFILPFNTFAEFLVDYEADLDKSVWEYDFRKVNEQGSFLGGDYHPNTRGYKIIAWELFNRINKFYD